MKQSQLLYLFAKVSTQVDFLLLCAYLYTLLQIVIQNLIPDIEPKSHFYDEH